MRCLKSGRCAFTTHRPCASRGPHARDQGLDARRAQGSAAPDQRARQAKIGVITAANIEGDAILIEGFIYATDFPEVAAEIKASHDLLGFSYEAHNLYTSVISFQVDDPNHRLIVTSSTDTNV
jgi:hypothetical protein